MKQKQDSGKKKKNQLVSTHSSRSLINSQPLLANVPEKNQTLRGHFGVLTGMSKFGGMIVHRDTNRKKPNNPTQN